MERFVSHEVEVLTSAKLMEITEKAVIVEKTVDEKDRKSKLLDFVMAVASKEECRRTKQLHIANPLCVVIRLRTSKQH